MTRYPIKLFIVGALLVFGMSVYAGGNKRNENQQQQGSDTTRGGSAGDMGYDMGYGTGY